MTLLLASERASRLVYLSITEPVIIGEDCFMAGNASAFTTAWRNDIYRTLIKKVASGERSVSKGCLSTVLGVAISIGTACLVIHFKSFMDYVTCMPTSVGAPCWSSSGLFIAFITRRVRVEAEGL